MRNRINEFAEIINRINEFEKGSPLTQKEVEYLLLVANHAFQMAYAHTKHGEIDECPFNKHENGYEIRFVLVQVWSLMKVITSQIIS